MVYTGRYNESVAYDLDAFDVSDEFGNDEAVTTYDFELFAPRTRHPYKGSARGASRTADTPVVQNTAAQPQKEAKTYAKVNRSALIRIAAVGALMTAAFVMLIVSQVQSHELTRSIAKRQQELAVLDQDYDAMIDKFNTEMSDSAIAEYAANQIGLQPRDNNQTIYVSLDSGDVFEFAEDTAR